jgi:hypothetical protein
MTTNIFTNPYVQPENKLTYCFLTLIEHSTVDTAMALLGRAGLPLTRVESLEVSLLYGGRVGNPDGSITLNGDGKSSKLLFENKTWRRSLSLDQIERHLRAWSIENSDTQVLIISHERRDSHRVAGDPRILFMTWHDVLAFALKAIPKENTDLFLLRQFAEFLETGGEAWRATMVSDELLSAHSRYLDAAQADRGFTPECRRLIEMSRDVVIEPFKNEIGESVIADHWGRVGIECQRLKRAPFDQWIFVGVYYDPFDHGIPFKRPGEAEFAIFLDMPPGNRDQLALVGGIAESRNGLVGHGFEFNFPEVPYRNRWRVCFWRAPMRGYLNIDAGDIANMLRDKLRILLNSEFYKLARDAPVPEVPTPLQ